MNVGDVIPNSPRGCGTLREGGTYLHSGTGAGGTLNAWTWVLGSCFEGKRQIVDGLPHPHNLTITAPPRSMLLVHLAATLYSGDQQRMSDGPTSIVTPKALPALFDLPPAALLDHVGSSHYTPWLFFRETDSRGPNRRVPQDLGAQLAPYLPLPILFTHSKIPLLRSQRDAVMAYKWANEVLEITNGSSESNERTFAPTFYDPVWGLESHNSTGSGHWLVTFFRAMERLAGLKTKEVQYAKFVPPRLEVPVAEQIFGASWITDVIYVTPKDKDANELTDLISQGITPVYAGVSEGTVETEILDDDFA